MEKNFQTNIERIQKEHEERKKTINQEFKKLLKKELLIEVPFNVKMSKMQ